MDNLIRQDLQNELGPLDQTDALSVKAVLIADLVHLADIADAIHIKMVQGNPSAVVLLYNGKGRAVHRLVNAKPGCKPLGKDGFSHTKVPVQTVHLTRF